MTTNQPQPPNYQTINPYGATPQSPMIYYPPAYIQPPTQPKAQASLMSEEPNFEHPFAVGLIKVINAIYKYCYQAVYLFLLVLYVVAVPFVGMVMGCLDVTFAVFVRPFCRLTGRLFRDLFWSTITVSGGLFVMNNPQNQPTQPQQNQVVAHVQV